MLTRLARLGLVAIERRRLERDPFELGADRILRTPVTDLTNEQTAALDTLVARASTKTYHAALLYGVTGSGKTEIYLRLARAVREAGRGVLLMVPEIALTPAAAAIFRAAFGARVAIQHSGLSDGERYDQWQRIRRGDVDVVVGTRSAVFAPLDTRADRGRRRARRLVQAGGKPALPRTRRRGRPRPIRRRAHRPRLRDPLARELSQRRPAGSSCCARRRVLDRPMADVTIVDMRAEFAAEGPDIVLSARAARRDDGAPRARRTGNRPAQSPRVRHGVFCRQCGETMECPNCSVTLTVHREGGGRARCHYCNHSAPLPKVCGKCAGPYLEQLGFGTERVEEEVRALFPDARVARVDRDTIRKRGALGAILAKFARRELDVLVGTQMIAKGHDFPSVTLVGVFSADVGLGLADFRASERTFQLLTQVAGRAGRGVLAGQAVVQTLYPTHYSIQHACRQDYPAFYEDELTFRRAMRYPPAVAMINVIVQGAHAPGRDGGCGRHRPGLRIRGPRRLEGAGSRARAARPPERRAPRAVVHQGHATQCHAQGAAAVLEDRPELKRRTIVDVDPMSVL